MARLAEIDFEDDEDLALMKRVGAGDQRAFEELLQRHQHAVVGTVARLLGGDVATAEDVAQQVFVKLWKHAANYRPEAKFTTYLYTIVRHMVFNESRRRARKPVVSMEEREESVGFEASDESGASPDGDLMLKELQVRVAKEVEKLPEQQRLAMSMRQEGLSYEEIAEVLDVSVPAIKSVIFRARTTLKSALRPLLREDGLGV